MRSRARGGPTRRAALVGTVVAAALLAVAACTSPPARQPQATTTVPVSTPTPSTTTPTVRPIVPLTGQPIPKGAQLNHPAVAIKISDVRHAHPQVGIDRADIVFVEPIGVSYTRLIAVFHSNLPDRVGPIRSVRPTDVPLIAPLRPVFGHTMAARWVIAYLGTIPSIDSHGTLQVPYRSGAYVLDSHRGAPDHVFAIPKRLLQLARFTAPPQPYFSYAVGLADASAASSARAGSTVSVAYGPSWTIGWTYDAKTKRYLRSEPWGPHRMANGTRISATNVIVLRAASSVRKIGSASGAPVPILKLVNTKGSFIAFAGGHAIRGTWSKKGITDHFVLTTEDGTPLQLAPGKTWVELPSPTDKVTIR